MNNLADMDPLSYDYSYANYEHYNNMYNVKMEPLHQPLMPPVHNPYIPNPYAAPPLHTVDYTERLPTQQNPAPIEPIQNQEDATINTPLEEEIDTKEHIQLLPMPKRRQTKKKGKTSSYWNKKVNDANFPFYGCTICNVSYQTIAELDQHVTIHKGRITSYDIRVRNQIKRKEKRKELKKLKKLGKKLGKNVKKEDLKLELEIKPEDGYIGNEKTSEFTANNESGVNNENADQNQVNTETTEGENNEKDAIEEKKGENEDKKCKVPKLEKFNDPEDPRLLKLFKCFACQKQFSLSYYLKLHVRSHTDEKPYTCAECGQSFITASKLGRHTKRIHLAIRFQCRICYRFFSRFDILTRHFDKAHKEEKLEGEPYDYNAILPYLKELEQELKEKEEQKEESKEEKAPKKEEWDSEWTRPAEENKNEVVEQLFVGDNSYVKDDKIEPPIEDIIVEEVKVFPEDDIVVKVEKEDEADEAEDAGDDYVDDVKEESAKEDSFSDEDYFPSNTWAATPKLEEPPKSPPPKKRHKNSYPIKCEHCDKTINSASYYKVHLRTHTGDRPFKCFVCGRGFITSSKMHRHVLTHTEFQEGDGEQKMKTEGEEDVKPELEDGAENTGTKKRRKRKAGAPPAPPGPRKRAYQKRPHACAYCNKRFLHLDTLNVHKKSHEGEELILKCNFCLLVQPDEESQRLHESTHSGPRPYVCTVCSRTYTKKETMIYHRKTHGEETGEKRTEYICDICSKTFNAQCKLQRHIVSHRADKFVLRYECPVCAHMFNTKYHIQMHLTTHQKEGLIIEENRNEILAMVLQNARKIPQKSDTSVNLSDLIPADERSRVCNICGQVFHHFYYLEEHLKSHGSKIAVEDDAKQEEKKHICPICNKGFKLHYYLKLHSFTHTKEKPFICQQCGKGFITKGKLKRHLETHSGLKKFQCHICYKFFTRPSYLRIHVRTIHGTQDYNFRLDKHFLPVAHHSV